MKTIAAFAIVLATAVSVEAVELVVMATNSTALAGEKVDTIGIRVTANDVAVGGQDPVLVVQNLSFAGSANGPFHQLGAANQPDVQGVQTNFIDLSAISNAGPPSVNLGVVSANNALYKDTWWYNSPTGTLQGVIDSNGDTGKVTTNPASDGSGVYTLGAFPNSGTNAIGTTGYVFTPAGAAGIVPANATTGQTMTYSGTFGPAGADYWSPSSGVPFSDPNHILGDLLVANGGALTVPLMQIVVSGNVSIPDAGTFFAVGNQDYNVLGGPAATDPHAFLSYNRPVPVTPEPSSFVLVAIGAMSLAWAARRRRRA